MCRERCMFPRVICFTRDLSRESSLHQEPAGRLRCQRWSFCLFVVCFTVLCGLSSTVTPAVTAADSSDREVHMSVAAKAQSSAPVTRVRRLQSGYTCTGYPCPSPMLPASSPVPGGQSQLTAAATDPQSPAVLQSSSPSPSPSIQDFPCDGCIALGSGPSGPDFVCVRRPNGMAACNPSTTWQPALYGIWQYVTGLSSTLFCAIMLDNQFVCTFDGVNDGSVLTNVTSATVGTEHTCVVYSDYSAQCLGNNDFHQLDIGGPNSAQASGVLQAAAGGDFTCLLMTNGVPYCVGGNSSGQLQIPLQFTSNIEQLSAGYKHACAINTMGYVDCWGDNTWGQAQVPADLGPVSKVSAGGDHTCVLLKDSQLPVCWGPQNMAPIPQLLQGRLSFIKAGFSNTCAVTAAGYAGCWGTSQDNSMLMLPPGFTKLSEPALLVDANNTQCRVPFCKTCDPYSPDACLACIDGYYFTQDGQKQCGACPDNCRSCDSAAQCISCLPGYWLNSTQACVDCGIPGCNECDWAANTGFVCTSCVQGYELRGSSCGARPLGCGAGTFPAQCTALVAEGSRCDQTWIMQGASSQCVSGQQCMLMYDACLIESAGCVDCCVRIDSITGATWYLLRFPDAVIQCDPYSWWSWSFGR